MLFTEPLILARRVEISFSRYELTLFSGHLANGLLFGNGSVHCLFLLLVLYHFPLFPYSPVSLFSCSLFPLSPVPLIACCFVPLFLSSPVPLFPSFPIQVCIAENSRKIKPLLFRVKLMYMYVNLTFGKFALSLCDVNFPGAVNVKSFPIIR